jgi:hypothetical protein
MEWLNLESIGDKKTIFYLNLAFKKIARWYVYFQTKIQRLTLEGLAVEDVDILYGHLVFLRQLGIFYGHLVYFMVIWYFFRFGMCAKKNLATLHALACGL